MGHPTATVVRYVVLAWLCLAATLAYVSRNSLGVAEKTIRDDLGLQDLDLAGFRLTPKDQMGWAMGAFFLTYALCQLPAGWLGHVWGSRRALPFFAVLWSAATGVTALAGGFPLLLLARLGNGAAQAGIFPSTTNTIAKWFPATRRALPSGFLASFMSVGGAAGAALTSLLLPHLDWRWIFVLYSAPGVLWAVAFYLWFRDRPEEHAAVSAEELAVIRGPAPQAGPPPAAGGGEPTPWRAIFTSAPMGWICGQQFCRAAGYIFFSTWFATYLQEHREVSVTKAGLLTSLPLAAVVLGSLAGGQLSDWVLARTGSRRWSRQGVAVASLLACALLTLLAHPIENDQLAVLVISAGSFCASVAGPCGYSITIDMGGRHVTTVFSTMNMAGNLGAFVFPIVVPRLVRLGGWDGVYFLFVGIYVAAALCWLLLNPNGTIFDRPKAEG